eukprot:875099-Pleurochrysis_carterae.AAC.2
MHMHSVQRELNKSSATTTPVPHRRRSQEHVLNMAEGYKGRWKRRGVRSKSGARASSPVHQMKSAFDSVEAKLETMQE